MPIYGPGRWVNPADRPDWCDIAGAGRFAVSVEDGRFTRHFHDDQEIWFIGQGKAKILVDGGEHYVQAGDIVLTQPGDVHDVLEVYETLRGFFVETGHPAVGQTGHRYLDETDAAGHPVPAVSLPADFGQR